jgi:hypothetical protein
MNHTRSGIHGMTKRLSTDKLVRRHLGVSRLESLVSATRHCLAYPALASGLPEFDPSVENSKRIQEGVENASDAWQDGVDEAIIDPLLGKIGPGSEAFVGADSGVRDAINEAGGDADRWYWRLPIW